MKGERQLCRRNDVLDIIIVNYKSTDFLIRCLESIYNFIKDIPVKIYVYDNNSQDGVDSINNFFPEVLLTENRANVGFARAINMAIERSCGRYMLFLNPDTIVVDGFFESVLRYMEENEQVGVVGAKILDYDGSVQGSARSFPTPLTGLFGRSSFLSRNFPNNRFTLANILTNRSDGITPMEVDWVSGACMLVRRDAVRDVGLMDKKFFMYWEDADWCKRMWEKGWKVVYLPEASVIHYVGVSSEKLLFRSILEFHVSSYRLFSKYIGPSFWFLKPVVITGLSVRIPFAVASNLVQRWCGGYKYKTMPGEKAVSAEGDRRIRILRMIARLNIGGPAIHVNLLTMGLDKSRFHSTLVTGKISPQEGDMSYLFDFSNSKPIIITELQREISLSLDIKALIHIFKILRRENPDIVHTHTAKAGFGARMAVILYNLLCRKKVRMVHTFHGHVFKGYFSKQKSLFFIWVESLLARFTDVIIAISPTQKQELGEEFRIAPFEKIKIIPLGFNLDPFYKSQGLKGQFRKSLGLDDDTVLIGIIGRLVPIKNHMMFFRAARIFIDENPDIKIMFVAVGDGELRTDLEAYCKRDGLAQHVCFCGWIRDVPSVYADLDILALSSLNEGTPVSIIESMASSVPVISTNAGGVVDLLGPPDSDPDLDGFKVCERGILCRKDDAQGMAKGFKYLLRGDTNEKEQRIARARAFVEQRYSEKRLINDIEALYMNLMRQ